MDIFRASTRSTCRGVGLTTLATAVVLGRFGSSRPWWPGRGPDDSGAERLSLRSDRNADLQDARHDAHRTIRRVLDPFDHGAVAYPAPQRQEKDGPRHGGMFSWGFSRAGTARACVDSFAESDYDLVRGFGQHGIRRAITRDGDSMTGDVTGPEDRPEQAPVPRLPVSSSTTAVAEHGTESRHTCRHRPIRQGTSSIHPATSL